MSTSAERMKRKRSREAGYARKPFTEEMDALAWRDGVMQSHADTGMYDLAPKKPLPDDFKKGMKRK